MGLVELRWLFFLLSVLVFGDDFGLPGRQFFSRASCALSWAASLFDSSFWVSASRSRCWEVISSSLAAFSAICFSSSEAELDPR